VVAGLVSVCAVLDLPRRVAEGVPDAWAPPVLSDGALDLVGGARCAEQEPAGRTGEGLSG
jgi:hypothetical protein